MMPADERYLRDPAFHQLVDLIEQWVATQQYTPTEVREAAMLAALHYEYRTIRPRFMHRDAIGD